MMYRADFDIISVDKPEFNSIIGSPTDSEYFEADNDESALKVAQEYAESGTFYSDAGRCGLRLNYLVEVDEDDEFYGEKREPIYY